MYFTRIANVSRTLTGVSGGVNPHRWRRNSPEVLAEPNAYQLAINAMPVSGGSNVTAGFGQVAARLPSFRIAA